MLIYMTLALLMSVIGCTPTERKLERSIEQAIDDAKEVQEEKQQTPEEIKNGN